MYSYIGQTTEQTPVTVETDAVKSFDVKTRVIISSN